MSIIDSLKAEIDRLAAKQAKAQIAKAQKVASQCRREVAELKRLLRQREREIAHFRRQQPTADESPLLSVRFSAKSVKSQRQRLGLSVEEYARLVGVAPLTLRNWENGNARPRKAQLARLVELRGIRKADAMAKL